MKFGGGWTGGELQSPSTQLVGGAAVFLIKVSILI